MDGSYVYSTCPLSRFSLNLNFALKLNYTSKVSEYSIPKFFATMVPQFTFKKKNVSLLDKAPYLVTLSHSFQNPIGFHYSAGFKAPIASNAFQCIFITSIDCSF